MGYSSSILLASPFTMPRVVVDVVIDDDDDDDDGNGRARCLGCCILTL
jgi:hypothetical protein